MSKSGGCRDSGSIERDADFSLLEEEPPGVAEGVDSSIPDVPSPAGEFEGEENRENSGLKTELAEVKDKYIRLLAEFDNYRKRVARERGDLLKYQGENLIFDLLEVVDNLERALKHAEADPEKLREGLELIYRSFVDILNKWEIRSESSVGRQFDPLTEQAISIIPIPDVEPNTVLEELKKAYFYKDKLLREGQVIVSASREDPEEEGEAGSAETGGGVDA